MAKMDLTKQANEILRIAEESGAQSNFFFVTTFKRYQVQLNILNDLEKALKENGMLVTKEYVKGRENAYINPLVKELPKHSDSSNKTLAMMLDIIERLGKKQETKGSKLGELMNE